MPVRRTTWHRVRSGFVRQDPIVIQPFDARRPADVDTRRTAVESVLADRRERVRYRSGKAPLIKELMSEAHAWPPTA